MRLVEDTQFQLGQVPIDEIQFDPKCRDDIPAVLRGLQGLYMDDTVRTKIFEILEKRLLPDTDLQRGCPGDVAMAHLCSGRIEDGHRL